MSRFVPRLLRNADMDAELSDALAGAVAIQPAPAVETPSILDRNISSVSRALDSARQHESGLAIELARITEELRQTRVSIGAFELAHGRMVEGQGNG